MKKWQKKWHSFKILIETRTNVWYNDSIIGGYIAFNTNKNIGNSSLGIAIAYFTNHDYIVSIPLNDTQDYDLVIEKYNKLYTVQVKTTGCKTKYNVYQVALKSCGGTKGKEYKTVVDTNVDYIFILDAEQKMYLIPKTEIVNKSTINLGKRTKKYRVNI